MFNILVTEDDSELRNLYCKVLEKNGYKAFPAVSGEDALDVLDREYIDLLICDVMMPD
ncbi:MAG: response regulator, partial [Clostridia bacterium]|nr:response regulator [Clostridia bacterium]